jgi:hypothetical protein
MTYKEQKPEGYNLGALAGRAFERERIIKLIEETILIHADQKFFLIKSIKGEQND